MLLEGPVRNGHTRRELQPTKRLGPRRGRQPGAESRVALTLVVAWCEPMLAVLLPVVDQPAAPALALEVVGELTTSS